MDARLHGELADAGLAPGPIARPFCNPKGEFRLADSGGYVVMAAQTRGASARLSRPASP